MSTQSAPYYWLTCDGLLEDGKTCGERSTEGGDFGAWESESSARDEAEGGDWARNDGKDYCEAHRTQFDCDDCGELKEECVCDADRADTAEDVTL